MRFLIVTPSLDQLDYLRRCVASVADQVSDSVRVHHHIQDGGSTDGTIEFLATQESQKENYRLTFACEPDEGLYDAISRGWSRHAKDADVVAWLNCDEQYLEGALSNVAEWFSENRFDEVLFGDALVIDPDGNLLCYRQAMRPLRRHIATSYLPVFSAAMFIRSSCVVEHDLFPDASWTLLGDVELVFRALEKNVRLGMLHEPLSAFVDSGENFSLSGPAESERKRTAMMLPPLERALCWLWPLEHRLRRLLSGAYRSRGVDYSIYSSSPEARVTHHCPRAPTIWKNRL